MVNKLRIAIFFGLAFIGCKKYEDDPVTSRLLTVKARITAHSWDHAGVYNYKTGHVIQTTAADAYYTRFSRPDNVSSKAPYLFGCSGWELVDKKNVLRISFPNGDKKDFRIKTLTWDVFELENDSIRLSLQTHP